MAGHDHGAMAGEGAVTGMSVRSRLTGQGRPSLGRPGAPSGSAQVPVMQVIEDPQGATFIASQFVPQNKDLGA